MKLLDTDSEATLLMNVWLQVYSESISNNTSSMAEVDANRAVESFKAKFLDYPKNED